MAAYPNSPNNLSALSLGVELLSLADVDNLHDFGLGFGTGWDKFSDTFQGSFDGDENGTTQGAEGAGLFFSINGFRSDPPGFSTAKLAGTEYDFRNDFLVEEPFKLLEESGPESKLNQGSVLFPTELSVGPSSNNAVQVAEECKFLHGGLFHPMSLSKQSLTNGFVGKDFDNFDSRLEAFGALALRLPADSEVIHEMSADSELLQSICITT